MCCGHRRDGLLLHLPPAPVALPLLAGAVEVELAGQVHPGVGPKNVVAEAQHNGQRLGLVAGESAGGQLISNLPQSMTLSQLNLESHSPWG